jgi:endoribonuclease Dicer
VIASPKIEVYFYGPVGHSNLTTTYIKELDGYKSQVIFFNCTGFIFGPVNMSFWVLFFSFFVLQQLLMCFEQSECMLRESACNFKESQKKLKSLWRLHENLIFCLQEVGLFGALQVSLHSLFNQHLNLYNLASVEFLLHRSSLPCILAAVGT